MKIAATFLGEENSIMGMMTDKYVLKKQSEYLFLFGSDLLLLL